MPVTARRTNVVYLDFRGENRDDEELIRRLNNFISNNRLFPVVQVSQRLYGLAGGFKPEDADRIMKFYDSQKARKLNVPDGDTVVINGEVPKWEGTKGVVIDRIPDTDWYNVEVTDANGEKLRLALRSDEFDQE
jgi:hypothetical protein